MAPGSLHSLALRARALAGRSLAELCPNAQHGPARLPRRTKGHSGRLLERLLGATAGSRSVPDFPELGVELKTIPVDARGRPRESTFVCSLSLAHADRLEWSDSPVRHKLAHVLWVPIVAAGTERRIGIPFFWQPSIAQENQLRADFEEIVGMVAIGQIEGLTARVGRYLQARPKAAHGKVRTRAYGADGEPLDALPRGFYLRARFTRELFASAGC